MKPTEKAMPMKAMPIQRLLSSDKSVTMAVERAMFPLNKPPSVRESVNNKNDLEDINHSKYDAAIPA